jgi:hypothetical protein
MKYALLIYSRAEDAVEDQAPRPIDARIAAALARPEVAGWVRLKRVESATTVRREQGRTLLTDGPFIESKEFLGGVVLVEADNLDGAIAVAAELEEARARRGAIEVRPIRDEPLAGA